MRGLGAASSNGNVKLSQTMSTQDDRTPLGNWPFGAFAAVGALITPGSPAIEAIDARVWQRGDAGRTTQDIVGSEGLFRWDITSLLLVVILDIVVATAAHPVHAGEREPQPLALIILNISRRALRMLLRVRAIRAVSQQSLDRACFANTNESQPISPSRPSGITWPGRELSRR
jgi:hypothetical protein